METTQDRKTALMEKNESYSHFSSYQEIFGEGKMVLIVNLPWVLSEAGLQGLL